MYGDILIVLSLTALSLLVKACVEKEAMSAHNGKVPARWLCLFYGPSSHRQNRKRSKHLPWPVFHSALISSECFFCLCPVDRNTTTLPLPLPWPDAHFGSVWVDLFCSFFCSLSPSSFLLPLAFHCFLFFLQQAIIESTMFWIGKVRYSWLYCRGKHEHIKESYAMSHEEAGQWSTWWVQRSLWNWDFYHGFMKKF